MKILVQKGYGLISGFSEEDLEEEDLEVLDIDLEQGDNKVLAEEIVASNGNSFILNDYNKRFRNKIFYTYKDGLLQKVVQNVALAISQKIQKIEDYDQSESVNEFTYKGVAMWVSRADRIAIINGIKAEQEMGLEETTITLPNGTQITLPIADALQLLYGIETYAKACYNVTAGHKMAVSQLTSVEEVENYDHTANYPTKITIE